MGHNHVISGNSKYTGIPQVDRLSTGPSDFGCHNVESSVGAWYYYSQILVNVW